MQPEEAVKDGGLTSKDSAYDWWGDTVVLTFLPMIFSIVTSLCRSGSVDFSRLFGDGELILSAFLISAPSLLKFFKENYYKKGNRLSFYLLFFTSLCQLVAYISIKTNTENIALVVYIASGLCVFSSIIISWQVEKHMWEVGK